jgi:hypothetical protein
MNLPLSRPALAVLSLALCSCATPGFERAWKRAAASPPPAGDVTGPWTGEWSSVANGHAGKLRCLVERQDEDTLEFRYWATWAGWMKGSFQVTGDIQPGPDGSLVVEGTKRLFPFGTYSHTGTLRPDGIEAEFRSKKKNLGSFRLERP